MTTTTTTTISARSSETARAAVASSPPRADRYFASDFKTLTNRVPRRLTSPAFTPDSLNAHQPDPSSFNKAAAPLSQGVATSDKRAPFNPYYNTSITTAPVNNFAHGSTSPTLSGQSNIPSRHYPAGLDQLHVCIAEDNNGRCRFSIISSQHFKFKPPEFCEQNSFTRSYAIISDLYCKLLFPLFLLTYLLPNFLRADAGIMRSTGIAQSFLESVNASIAPKDQQQPSPILDATSPVDIGTCECCCRCGKGPKLQSLGRRVSRKTKSYTNLRTGISELSGFDLDLPRRQDVPPVEKKQYGKGESPIETLPTEVLGERSLTQHLFGGN